MSNSPQKVYIVTAGEYSDYHICRVFLSKEKAELYSSLVNGGMVEEFDASDESVTSADYCYGHVYDHISVFRAGETVYSPGDFTPDYGKNSVDDPEFDGEPPAIGDQSHCTISFERKAYEDRLALAQYSPLYMGIYGVSNTPPESLPEFTISRCTRRFRSDRLPPVDVLKKQMFDLASEVKYQLAHGVSPESVRKWLSMQ